MRAVRLLRRAQADLLEIDRFLTTAAPDARDAVIDGLLDDIARLGQRPFAGPVPRDERLARLRFRYVISGRYLVFYRVTPRLVRVYRVLHNRRAYERLL